MRTASLRLASLLLRNSWMFNVRDWKSEEYWAGFISPNSSCLHISFIILIPFVVDGENCALYVWVIVPDLCVFVLTILLSFKCLFPLYFSLVQIYLSRMKPIPSPNFKKYWQQFYSNMRASLIWKIHNSSSIKHPKLDFLNVIFMYDSVSHLWKIHRASLLQRHAEDC